MAAAAQVLTHPGGGGGILLILLEASRGDAAEERVAAMESPFVLGEDDARSAPASWRAATG